MRRQPGPLERDHLAVLVHRRECDDRAEQHREREHEGDDLRAAQRDVAPHLALAVARKREDVTRFAEQIRSEEHTSELQSLMRISYAVFCLKTKKNSNTDYT